MVTVQEEGAAVGGAPTMPPILGGLLNLTTPLRLAYHFPERLDRWNEGLEKDTSRAERFLQLASRYYEGK